MRNLTPGEINMLRDVFGDSIKYNEVMIHPTGLPAGGVTLFGDVYINSGTAFNPEVNQYQSDYSKEGVPVEDVILLFHEMTHVWQSQNGYPTGPIGFDLQAIYKTGVVNPYDYTIDSDSNKSFKDYNMEQQAKLIQQYQESLLDKTNKYTQAQKDALRGLVGDFINSDKGIEWLPSKDSVKEVAEDLRVELLNKAAQFTDPGSLTSWYETVVKGAVNLLKTIVNEIEYFGQEVVSSVERLVDKLLRPDATPPDTQSTTVTPSINDLSQSSVMEIEHELSKMHNAGSLSLSFYNDFTQNVSDYLVLDTYFNPSVINIPNIYDGFDGLSLNPIGAFYESVTPANDPALSIADKTYVLLDSTNKGITASALASKDTNTDGKLNGTELTGLNMWRDLNENGVADTGEITTLTSQNITSLRAEDYGFHTKGNTIAAPAILSAPTHVDKTLAIPTKINKVLAVPASNFRTLRDTDNTYYYSSGGYLYRINWASNQIKINSGNTSYLIGTDGNDAFDSNYYAASTQFNSSLLVNFLAGGGNDLMGGSIRNDNLWGGTGADTLLGYANNQNFKKEKKVA